MSFGWHRAPLIFVYGTLRRGEKNHALLAGRADWMGPADCQGLLYSIDDRYPALILEEGGPHLVVGELYAPHADAREALLKELDALEAVDEQLYSPHLLDRPGGEWLVYIAGPELIDRCTPGRQILSGDWCRHRQELGEAAL